MEMNSSTTDSADSGGGDAKYISLGGWEVDPAIANLLAGVASVCVIMMWMAPFREMWTSETSIYKTRNAERINTAFGFVAGVVQSTLWVMYSCNKLDRMGIPFLVNAFGALLNLSFVACYWYFSKGEQRKLVQMQILALSPAIPFGIGIWVFMGDNALVGYCAMTINILMLFGPLAAARQVIRKRSNEGMILAQVVLILISSSVWFCYAIYIFDPPSIVCNSFGILFGILQNALYCWAGNQRHKINAQLQRVEVDDVALN